MGHGAQTSGLLEVLPSAGPSPELGEAAGVYGWLVGSWITRAIDYLPDGQTREAEGEWHFGWVLEGRAVQDVWICPRRSLRGPGLSKAGNRYGTTLRVYDQGLKAWRVTWINPVTGMRNDLVGLRRGADIVQEGADPEGHPIRWVFTDIRPGAFRWYGERSIDGGKTWRLEVEFFARRSEPTASGRER
ncbi:MAG TPA: hypothetical protein VEJ89_13875 [Myxococcaceae bacterium]|nr:hypothetical protein [Myxococcaceae bacterium]